MNVQDRLTVRTDWGDYSSAKSFESMYEEICALRNRLGLYEDIGLKPEEIKKILKTLQENT